MIVIADNKRLIESVADLPPLPDSIDLLFADFETTSFDDCKDSLNPWHHCYPLGLAFTFDNHPLAYYIPVGHRDDSQHSNLSIRSVAEYWLRLLTCSRRWINHNIKYDSHVSANSLGVVPPESTELFCTVVHSKIIDSDRQYKGGYRLDSLSRTWLSEDIAPYEAEINRWLNKRRDFSVIPAKPMADYACQDVITNRRLYKYIESMRPPECNQVAAMETELTRVLFDMERNGLCVDKAELQLREIEVATQMLLDDAELASILGRTINPNSGDDVYDVLCNQYGLPVMGWTEEDDEGEPAGNPSFDKAAMKRYATYPHAPTRVVELIGQYRKLSTHRSLFLQKYQELQRNGRLNPTYNQLVRSGRMSCRDPNAQQLDGQTKELIHPPPGWAFLSADQSQIEFRVICHYINDCDAIKAYNENPDTDFHQWVADMSGMKRKPAKTMNFMMGYGGGKKKAVKMLAADTEVVGGIVGQVDQMLANGMIADSQRQSTFEKLCKEKAEQVYDNYHKALPTLKPTTRRAAKVCEERGYVFNLHGRRRHLPKTHAHVAFNSLCQGEAADIQKERTIALARALKDTPIQMVANVHDATVAQGPIEVIEDRRTQIAIAWILEHPNNPLRVPLRVSLGTSRKHWKEADDTAASIHYTADELAWLQSTPQDQLFDWLKGNECSPTALTLPPKGKCTDTCTPEDSATTPVLGNP